MSSQSRTLVAGVGNIFRGDDGFGSEVARELARHPLPEGVRVADYGIGGTHLAYDLLDGWDRFVLIDVVPRRDEAGAVHLVEVGPDDVSTPASADPHGMDPGTVLATLGALGGTLPPTTIVACEAGSVDDGIGLSPAVAAAVPVAVTAVLDLLAGGVSAGERS